MSRAFEDALIREFCGFSHQNFTVHLTPAYVFMCGGIVDVKQLGNPPSVRHLVIEDIETNSIDAKEGFLLIQAEEFKDYFEKNAYSNLLDFEEDIAQISGLIVIFAESPGSLVELGLFCNNKFLKNKLIVFLDSERVRLRDSFIYLGVSEFLKENGGTVSNYPLEQIVHNRTDEYRFISKEIVDKLNLMNKTEKFNAENKGHIALLIYEVVLISKAILVTEIELALLGMEINIEPRLIHRLLYLLGVLKLVGRYPYSSVDYYYPLNELNRRVSFGRTKDGKIRDILSMKMALRQTINSSVHEGDKKRQQVIKKISQEAMVGDGQ